MFRILRWVYKLGVNQERNRIARFIENEYSSRRSYITTAKDMLQKNQLSNKTSKQRLEFQIAVKEEVVSIVNQVLAPRWNEMQPPESFLFPDEGKK